jgi:FkbM family methyltransferase
MGFYNKIFFPFRLIIILFYKLGFWKKAMKLKYRTFYGNDIYIVLPEIVSSIIFLYGHFEKDVEIMLIKYLKRNDCFIDIGAHIGYFSLFASHIVTNSGYIYSFEPTPSIYKMLNNNCKNILNITTINKGVYSDCKKALFKDFGLRYSAFNTLGEDRIQKRIIAKNVEIKLISLDQYFKNRNRKINFIKIDAENSEYNILKGAKKILEEDKPILCIEFKSKNQSELINKLKIVEFLKKMKYKPIVFKKNILESEKDWDKITSYDNVLFVHKI